MQSNNFSELHTTDAFQEGFDRFQSSALFDRLQEKFRLKPYFERNKLLRQVTAGVSYFLNAFSMATAVFFVYAFLSAIIPWSGLAGAFAFVFLAFLEALKRLTIPSFFQRFFQFRQVAFAQLAIIALLASLSCFLSFKGASDAILALTSKPELIDLEAVRAPYLERIKSLEAQKADLKKTSTYQGVYTSRGARSAERIDASISQLDAELLAKTGEAEASNKAQLEAHVRQTGLKAEYFAGLALIFDLALILALGWLEYYDYRSLAEFAKHKGANKAAVQAQAPGEKTVSLTVEEAQEYLRRLEEQEVEANEEGRFDTAERCKRERQKVSRLLQTHNIDIYHSNGNGKHIDSATDHFDQAPAQEGSRVTVEGFRRSADQGQRNALDAMRGGGTSGTLKHCEHCSKSFLAKTTWQRFCTTQCRETAWTLKTGRPLKHKQKVSEI